MTFDEMNILITFSKYPNFHQCASLCGVNRTTVSRTLQKIEKEYNILLFTQTSKNIRFTEEGMQVIRSSLSMLQLYEQMKTQLSNKVIKPRKIKIGIMYPLMPHNLLNSKRYQNAAKFFDVSLIPCFNQTLLETGEVDFIYGIEGQETNHIAFSELGRDDFIIVFQQHEKALTYLSEDNARYFHPLPEHFQLIDLDDYNLIANHLLKNDNICIWHSEINYLTSQSQYIYVDSSIAIHRHFGLYHLHNKIDSYLSNFIMHLEREK